MEVISSTLGTYQHATSTAPMGGDQDASAVVDWLGAVRGVEDLRVVDASIFPEGSSLDSNKPDDDHGCRAHRCTNHRSQPDLSEWTEQIRSRTLQINGEVVSCARLQVYPGLATLSGQPATAFPWGRTRNGLPIGLQVIGPYLEDRTPITFASLLEREFGGFVPPAMIHF